MIAHQSYTESSITNLFEYNLYIIIMIQYKLLFICTCRHFLLFFLPYHMRVENLLLKYVGGGTSGPPLEINKKMLLEPWSLKLTFEVLNIDYACKNSKITQNFDIFSIFANIFVIVIKCPIFR